MQYLSTKCRLCRREGTKLYLKGERCFSPKCPIDRKGAIAPGAIKYRGRKLSSYGQQLREKQKLKRTYMIMERQMKNYFQEALKTRGDSGEFLLQLLERRLDSVCYRSGLAVSRRGARQLIDHGLIMVDGKKVKIPSYLVRLNQVINLSEKALKQKHVKELIAKKKKTPAWLERKVHVVKINRLPTRDDIGSEVKDHLIVEFYSR
jgi:small subunit ribosomal protein S4